MWDISFREKYYEMLLKMRQYFFVQGVCTFKDKIK